MNFPDDATLSRYLYFIYLVTIQVRHLAYTGASHQQIGELMDVVHNLPTLLSHWEDFNAEWFTADLREFDKKWAPPDETPLMNTYQECMNRPVR